MRFVIVGPGALGSLLAARLWLYSRAEEEAGNDSHQVVLLDYKPDRAAILNKKGLKLEEGEDSVMCHPVVTTDRMVTEQADVLFFCIKSISFANSLAEISPGLAKATLFLAMQNGVGHLDQLSSLRCLAGVGVTTEGANLAGPGHVRHGGHGITRIGLLAPEDAGGDSILQETAGILSSAGLTTRVTTTPLEDIWAKLFVNVGINALSGLHRCPNGKLLESVELKEMMIRAVREAEAVARAKGIAVNSDPVAETISVCEMTAENISSMHQDILLGRRTEIDAINGAVVAEAERLGIDTPVNRNLVEQIRRAEAKTGQPGQENTNIE